LWFNNISTLFLTKMVEVAGVEPASWSPSSNHVYKLS